MTWIVEYTDEFGNWYQDLTLPVQDDVDRIVGLLEVKGPQLPFLYSSGIENSRHAHMRELRIQHAGQPFRVFYAFDPRRAAILLISGCKVAADRFYETMIPVADALYDDHVEELRREGLLP
jgi:hypothetical protein